LNVHIEPVRGTVAIQTALMSPLSAKLPPEPFETCAGTDPQHRAIPAQAEISVFRPRSEGQTEIPACAGMTRRKGDGMPDSSPF
jgi:hypothetical protein